MAALRVGLSGLTPFNTAELLNAPMELFDLPRHFSEFGMSFRIHGKNICGPKFRIFLDMKHLE